MKRSVTFFVCALLTVGSLQAADIVWISFHSGDNAPSAAAATAGFTQAPDVGYTELLRANGHLVTRIVTSDIPNSGLLNMADLVIISRSVPSGHYELDAETAAWNGITAPMMIMGGYVLRNTRLGFTTGTTIPDVNSNPVRLTINQPLNPIFSGITLDGTNTMVNPYASIASFNGNPQRGISVNTNPLAGNGTLLASIGTPGDAAVGGTVIAEWAAGSIMGNSPPDTLGGRRLVFLSGSRESGTPALTAEGAGIFDLNPDGSRMFLNAVNYMAIPEPSSGLLIALGTGVALLGRRKRS